MIVRNRWTFDVRHRLRALPRYVEPDTSVLQSFEKANTLVYFLAYPNRDAAAASWKAFRADPDWVKAQTASEKDGKLVAKVDSVYLTPTDFSRLK